jgi:dTDP-4-dehydrorhamnose reductase
LILILEAAGRPLLGLARGLEAVGRAVSIARDFDVSSMKSVRAAVERAKPAAVILTGGMEDPLACEEDPAQAFVMNAEGAIHLAAAAMEFSAVPVLISTAAVLGDAGGEHGEDEAPDPRTAYGRSKLQGETFLLRAAKNGLVVRVGHVLEDGLARERGRMREQIEASEREPISVIGAFDLGTAIDRLLAEKATGVVHAACGTVSELELWRTIGARVDATFRKGGAALSCGRLERIGLRLRDWQTALSDAARFDAPAPEPRARIMAQGEAIAGNGPAEIAVLTGKVVVEEREDRILKTGQTAAVEGTYRITAIEASEISILGLLDREISSNG